MHFDLSDTIAALASSPGPGGRAVVRLSGDDVVAVVRRIVQLNDPAAWDETQSARRLSGNVPLSGVAVPLPIDAWYWPTRRSYTGQPSIELHCVSSPPLVTALLSELYARGARPAQAGEFTLRAFLSNRIDLVQAEAVLGVIDAADDEQLSAALSQLAGGISACIHALQDALLIDLADLEAGLDFVDEDIEFISRSGLAERLSTSQATIRTLLEQADRRMQTRSQACVVLAGLPNAGKSTLFNVLCGRDAAIVSPVRGTTRDWLRADVVWDGHPVELCDTAGREDEQEDAGGAAQLATDQRLAQASLIVWCSAADQPAAELAIDAGLRSECLRTGVPLLHVLSKGDVLQTPASPDVVVVSAHTRAGLDVLRDSIVRALDARGQHVGELLGSTAARCRDSLRNVQEALQNAAELLQRNAGDELIAVELRCALEQSGMIAGQVTTDDLLDRVFSRFCIGK